MVLVDFNKPSDDPIDVSSHVTGIPGSTGGVELERMCVSGDFSSYSSPYTRGEKKANEVDTGLRVIEAFTFGPGEEGAFQEMQDVLHSNDRWKRTIGKALVVPLGTVMSVMSLPGALAEAVMTPSPSGAGFGDDTIFVTDKGVYHHNPTTERVLARTGGATPEARRIAIAEMRAQQENGPRYENRDEKGLLPFDDMKPLPAAGGDLKGPDAPFACDVAVGLLLPLVAFPGPTCQTPDRMVSFQLESISTHWVKRNKGLSREIPNVQIPINAFEPGAGKKPRVYPQSALLYKMIEAGKAGKLPGPQSTGRLSFFGAA